MPIAMERRTETATVKAALVKAGYKDVKVGHGRGTAWGWLHLKVSVPGPIDCYCDQVRIGRCPPCNALWRRHYTETCTIAQSVTGRSGEYDGRINNDVIFS